MVYEKFQIRRYGRKFHIFETLLAVPSHSGPMDTSNLREMWRKCNVALHPHAHTPTTLTSVYQDQLGWTTNTSNYDKREVPGNILSWNPQRNIADNAAICLISSRNGNRSYRSRRASIRKSRLKYYGACLFHVKKENLCFWY